MKFNIAVNKNIVNKLPEGYDDWKTANGQFENGNMTTTQFAANIKKGYAWCNPHRRYRDRKNFIQGSVVGVDIDKGDKSLDELMAIPFIDKYAGIVHTTPSHTPDRPRYRIIFVLSSPVRSREKFETIVDSIITSFSTVTTDKACKDAQRLFYGSKGCDIVVREDRFLPIAIAVFKYAKPYMAEQEKRRLAYLERIKNHTVYHNGSTPPHLVKSVRDKLVGMVINATDGEKAFMLNKAAFTAGGYVAGQYFDQYTIQQDLYNAIASKDNVRDIGLAERIIEKGIQKGMNKPLLITEEPDEFALFGM